MFKPMLVLAVLAATTSLPLQARTLPHERAIHDAPLLVAQDGVDRREDRRDDRADRRDDRGDRRDDRQDDRADRREDRQDRRD